MATRKTIKEKAPVEKVLAKFQAQRDLAGMKLKAEEQLLDLDAAREGFIQAVLGQHDRQTDEDLAVFMLKELFPELGEEGNILYLLQIVEDVRDRSRLAEHDDPSSSAFAALSRSVG